MWCLFSHFGNTTQSTWNILPVIWTPSNKIVYIQSATPSTHCTYPVVVNHTTAQESLLYSKHHLTSEWGITQSAATQNMRTEEDICGWQWYLHDVLHSSFAYSNNFNNSLIKIRKSQGIACDFINLSQTYYRDLQYQWKYLLWMNVVNFEILLSSRVIKSVFSKYEWKDLYNMTRFLWYYCC
jgi:hypothetical protein